jgi:hypothetical protein
MFRADYSCPKSTAMRLAVITVLLFVKEALLCKCDVGGGQAMWHEPKFLKQMLKAQCWCSSSRRRLPEVLLGQRVSAELD